MEVDLDHLYGLVILVFVASIFLLQWMAYNVVKARKQYDVKYPTMYSDKNQIFNCYQRAHQNTLEVYPLFLTTLFLGGLYAPMVAAIAGVVWLVSRVVYAQGYYSGEPANRNKAAFGYIGLLTNLACTIGLAVNLLLSGDKD